MAKENDVIQVNEKVEMWCGCLMVVDKVKEWGIRAYMKVPYKGNAFVNLKHDEYEVIGEAILTRAEDE